MSRITELSDLLRAANIAYAQGQPFISDLEYDQHWYELYKLDPNNPALWYTANLVCDSTIPHTQKMLGLNKAMCMQDLKVFLTRFGNEPLLLQPKYDGVSLIIYHPASPSMSPIYTLQGDGLSGANVSHLLCDLSKRDVEDLLESRPWLRCEALILHKDFSRELGANPRNTVAGMLNPKRLVPHEKCDLITLVPHDDLSTEFSPWQHPSPEEALWDKCLALYAQWGTTYPIDGIVIKVKGARARANAGHNGNYPHWAIAWKPPISIKETRVTNVEWNVSRSGRVVPTVVYEPIELCGTINRRATGNNAVWLRTHRIHRGALISVGKAGEIIPKILGYARESNEDLARGTLPTCCPVCKGELKLREPDLICINKDCITQVVKQLAFFYGNVGMDLKGVGEQRLWELLQEKDMYDIFHTSPWRLLNPDWKIQHAMESAWGTEIATTVMRNSEQLSGTRNEAHFLTALGAKGIGYKSALSYLQWLKQMKGATLPSNHKTTSGAFLEIIGLYARGVRELTESGFTFMPLPTPSHTKYCITGAFTLPREQIISLMERLGYQYVSAISKEVKYLFVGENTHETVKMRQAKEKGVTILSHVELNKILNKEPL